MAEAERPSPPFSDFASLYAHLEEKALDYQSPLQIAQLFQGLRDQMKALGKPDEVRIAQREIDVFYFRMKDGELLCMGSSTDDKGQTIKYPTQAAFDEDALTYFDKRLQHSRNALLRARYAHFLWDSAKKHQRYAQAAVESYSALVKFYEEKERQAHVGHFSMDILNAVVNAFKLAVQSNCLVAEACAEVRRLVRDFNRENSSAPVLEINLIKLMLNDFRRFTSADFCGVQDICSAMALQLSSRGNLDFAIDMLQVGEKVDTKTGRTSYPWKRQTAECYEAKMTEAEAKKNLACVHFCQEAMTIYRELKNEPKVKELQRRYEQLKTSIPLSAVSSEIDVTEAMKRLHEVAERLTENTTEAIIVCLIHDNGLLPKRTVLLEQVEALKKFPEFVMSSKCVVDANGHTSQHFVTDEEKASYALLCTYHNYIQFPTLPLLHQVVLKGLEKGKLSSASLLDVLKAHSWLGKPLQRQMPSGQTEEYDWVTLIAPAVHQYFEELVQAKRNPEYRPNFILCTDSLTLKLEGILRDLCRCRGGETFNMTEDEAGRKIVRVKDANALLHDQTLTSFLSEDDLLFLKYLLVEKAGLNLRNRVAHSLMLPSEYSIDTMHLLVLAVLRLGRFTLRRVPDVGECATPEGEQPKGE